MKKAILLSSVMIIVLGLMVWGEVQSFSFYNESLPQAFMDISTQFNIPIVVDNSVTGEITANLNNVTLEEALGILCKKAGLFYFKKDGVYFVGSQGSSSAMKLYGYETRVIPLKYISASGAMTLLSNYAKFITYAPSEPVLVFSGPQEVYERAVKRLESVDVAGPALYVAYSVYEVSNEVWKNGGNRNGALSLLDSMENGSFTSVNFKDFATVTASSQMRANGFAKVKVGSNANFSVKDLGFKMSISLPSFNDEGAVMKIDLSSSSLSNFEISSKLKVNKGKIAVSAFKYKGKEFVVEVGAFKTSGKISKLANLWPSEKKEKDFFFMLRGFLTYPAFESFARYGKFAISVKKDVQDDYPFVAIGMNDALSENLRAYLFIGASAAMKDMNELSSYFCELALTQSFDFDSEGFVSSGYLLARAPLNDLAAFEAKYVGNMEYNFSGLLLGGSVSYDYDNDTGKSSFDAYVSGGIVLKPWGVMRILYSPFSKETKGEIDISM